MKIKMAKYNFRFAINVRTYRHIGPTVLPRSFGHFLIGPTSLIGTHHWRNLMPKIRLLGQGDTVSDLKLDYSTAVPVN